MSTIEPTIGQRIRPADYGSLDWLLYTAEDTYRNPPSDEEVEGWILEAVAHHLENSPTYARLAATRGFDLAAFAAEPDLGTIPLLSSGSFKRRAVVTETGSAVRRCTSSGTMGTKSVVLRDNRTIERFVGSMLHGMRHFMGRLETRQGIVLGPPREEAGDLWFAYSLSLAELINRGEFFVRDETFLPEAAWEALNAIPAENQLVLIAPPSLLVRFFEWMEERSLAIDLAAADPVVITAGGWKRNAKESVDREELVALANRLLGLDPANFRDVFNMVELNTIVLECEHGTKHLPPWLRVDARSPRTLRPLPEGEVGMLAYLDPTPLSYPGFVLSDDLGSVVAEACECGLDGPQMRIERRLESIEERGCGLKMNRYEQKGEERE